MSKVVKNKISKMKKNDFEDLYCMIFSDNKSLESIELEITNGLKMGLKINNQIYKETILIAAYRHEEPPFNVITSLLKRKEVDVNIQDDDGKTALMHAYERFEWTDYRDKYSNLPN